MKRAALDVCISFYCATFEQVKAAQAAIKAQIPGAKLYTSCISEERKRRRRRFRINPRR